MKPLGLSGLLVIHPVSCLTWGEMAGSGRMNGDFLAAGRGDGSGVLVSPSQCLQCLVSPNRPKPIVFGREEFGTP